jgi:hypothetical protein
MEKTLLGIKIVFASWRIYCRLQSDFHEPPLRSPEALYSMNSCCTRPASDSRQLEFVSLDNSFACSRGKFCLFHRYQISVLRTIHASDLWSTKFFSRNRLISADKSQLEVELRKHDTFPSVPHSTFENSLHNVQHTILVFGLFCLGNCLAYLEKNLAWRKVLLCFEKKVGMNTN